MGSTDERDHMAYAAALRTIPGLGPASLVGILRRRSPADAWAAICDGVLRPSGPGADPMVRSERAGDSWQRATDRIDPVGWWHGIDHDIRVVWWGGPDYPTALLDDPLPPAVLFFKGQLAHLDRPCVAIVGTRNATPGGRSTAYAMGRDLAAAGVCVVSGLALGIDGAAHAGAVAARDASGDPAAVAGTVGVAASGVDVPYPHRHHRLWRQVIDSGAVISENLPGKPAQAWQFPFRNRIIAGLARLVVVVESHAAGGSLITVEAALERGKEVRVVPGPVGSPACEGSNQLLYDGPGPVRHAQDVLDALGIFRPAATVPSPGTTVTRTTHRYHETGGRGGRPEPGAVPAPAGPSRIAASVRTGRPPARRVPATPAPPREPSACEAVLAALGWEPVALDRLLERCGLPPAAVMAALEELEETGAVAEESGWWSRLA